MKDVIGRKAKNIRNNIRYDKLDRIVYSSGHAIILYNTLTYEKHFIYLKDDLTYSIQEITALEISKDKNFLIAGHSGTKAAVTLWHLSSKLLLKTLYLKELIMVLNMAISDDNKRLVVYGINAWSIGELMLIDI